MSRLILASKSAARIDMLRRARIAVEIMPADIDEEAFKQAHKNHSPETLAATLSFEKARAVSAAQPGAWVIGSDSLLNVGDDILSKAASVDDARDKLKTLRGKTHSIISGVSVCRDGQEIWSHVERSNLSMKQFTDDFLEDYLAAAGDVVTTCVGAYALENGGARLFDHIDGDFFTILGMPLLPLINFLEKEGVIT